MLKEKIKNKEKTVGMHINLNDVAVSRIAGLAGYDFIWIDMEHSYLSLENLMSHIIAIQATGTAVIVRVPQDDLTYTKKVIEMGVDGIIFPMVNTAEEARKCVALCQYPPKGIRGFGPLRGLDYGTKNLDDYIAEVDDSMIKLMQCEHIESVRNLDEILEVPGVDGIICGPMDLSASIGKMGKLDDPEVVELMQTIIDKCKAHNKPFGLSFGLLNKDVMDLWVGQGASFYSLGTPQDYFREMGKDVIKTVREAEAARTV